MVKLLAMELNIFVMIAVGFLIRKIKVVGEQAERDMTNLVLYVVLPCNIFNSFLGQDMSSAAGDCIAILLISIGIQILSMIYGKFAFPKETKDHRCNLAYGMICSNAGFLGNAISEEVFGSAGLMLTSVYLIPQRIMMWSEGLAIYAGASDVKGTIRKVALHPCVIGCFLGLIVMFTGITVPSVILTPIQTIGRCNTALSMMVIGMILSKIDLKSMVSRTVVRFTIHRLVLMPLVVYIICRLLPISNLSVGVATLLAAMPAGATTSMLSNRYGRDPEFATKLVIFSTLCSIPAVFIWSLILTM